MRLFVAKICVWILVKLGMLQFEEDYHEGDIVIEQGVFCSDDTVVSVRCQHCGRELDL